MQNNLIQISAKVKEMIRALAGARVARFYDARTGIDDDGGLTIHIINGRTSKHAGLTWDDFGAVKRFVKAHNWQIEPLSSGQGFTARPPLCPICDVRPVVTLEGFCQECQNAVDGLDAAELAEVL